MSNFSDTLYYIQARREKLRQADEEALARGLAVAHQAGQSYADREEQAQAQKEAQAQKAGQLGIGKFDDERLSQFAEIGATESLRAKQAQDAAAAREMEMQRFKQGGELQQGREAQDAAFAREIEGNESAERIAEINARNRIGVAGIRGSVGGGGRPPDERNLEALLKSAVNELSQIRKDKLLPGGRASPEQVAAQQKVDTYAAELARRSGMPVEAIKSLYMQQSIQPAPQQGPVDINRQTALEQLFGE